MNFWALLGYSFLSLIIVLVLVVIELVFYYLLIHIPFLKRKRLNIYFIVVSFLIVFVIHIACISNVKYESENAIGFWGMVNYGIKELYSELGGLGFEGQEISGNVSPFIESLYFGSITWLALSNAILIGFGISYPFYSKISLRFLTICFRFKLTFSRKYKNKNIYIFTYASEKSFILANNIKEKNNKARIIFSSNELEPFDKNNPVHHQISQMNYLYIPISKNHISQRKSIIKSLFKIGFLRYFFNQKRLLSFIEKYDINIFALKTYRNSEGYESKNNDIIFDDAELFLEELTRKNKHVIKIKEKLLGKEYKKPRTKFSYDEFCQKCEPKNKMESFPLLNYFVLSNNSINYEFYNERLFQIFKNVFNMSKTNNGTEYNKFENDYNSAQIYLYNLTVLNEAIMSGEDLINIRHSNLEKEFKLNSLNKMASHKVDEFINYSKNGYNTLVIGFGQKGQKALEHLYLDANGGIMVNGILEPTKFTAHVIDDNMNDIIGSYIATHPSFVFIDENNPTYSTKSKLRDIYKEYSDDDFEYIIKHMGFLNIYYKEGNFSNITFLKTIEAICKREYDFIIVALGDDEINIKCTNMILQNIRQTCYKYSNLNKDLHIYVNIIDHNNNKRLQWNDVIDSHILKNINVSSFGNLTEIYSPRMFDFENAININKIYKKTCDTNIFDKDTNWKYKYIHEVSIYAKKNNESAANYSIVYKKYLDENGGLEIIKNDYQNYLNFIKDNKKSLEFVEKKDDKNYYYYYCFDTIIDNEILKNNLYTVYNSDSKQKIHASIANYERINNFNSINLQKSNADYYWRYLIQLEHSRWMRHMMIYERAYVKDYKPRPPEKNFWKDNIKLHKCLLPYSDLKDFHSAKFNKEDKYLKYDEEDYDYGSIIVALDLDDDNENLEKNVNGKENAKRNR